MPANPNHGGLWTDQVWQNIDASVNAAAMANCVSQQVFPATQLPDVLSVPADYYDLATGKFTEGETRPYLELLVTFTLSNGQVNGDPTGQIAIRAATGAAIQLAGAVDGIFFNAPGYAVAAPVAISAGKNLRRVDDVGDEELGRTISSFAGRESRNEYRYRRPECCAARPRSPQR